jgi:putative IMPACT (imprinted ancient) family translation regulator
MLEVLLKRDLDMVLAVVVRYYGGRKLGAGGLVRAYSGTVAKTLDRAGERQVVDITTLQVAAPFALTDTVLRSVDELVAQHPDSSRTQPRFDGQGLVLELSLPEERAQQAIVLLTEVTRGAARISQQEPLSDP